MVKFLPIVLIALAAFSGAVAEAAEARIIKVLPHFLDLEGRASLSPSLYERDAYQAFLRGHPSEQSGMRFNVQWKAKRTRAASLMLRVELRTSKAGSDGTTALERRVHRSYWFSTWSALNLQGSEFENLGRVIAWRATLWEGEQELAELKSFLW